jgi:nicotinamidase-related amidase
MPLADARRALLLVVDLQTRLAPAIADGEASLAQARRLIGAAGTLGVPILATEQNPAGLGRSVEGLLPRFVPVVEKTSFDATRAPGLAAHLPADRDVLVVGWEAHVCVLQTAIGLLAQGRRVMTAADAVGSRTIQNREAGLARMAREGVEILTTEMAIFEWIGDAAHPRFREILAFVR